MKKCIIGVLAAIIALYLFFLLIIPNVIDVNKYNEQITQEVNKATGLQLVVDDYNLYTTLGLKIGLSANNAQLKYPNNNTMFKVKNLDISLKLLPLIFCKVQIDKINLENPEFNLNITQSGKTDIEEYIKKKIIPNFAVKETEGSDLTEKKEFPLEISTKLPKITIKNYKLNVYDEKTAEMLMMSGQDFVLSGDYTKNIKLLTNGKFTSKNNEIVKYNVKVDTFIPVDENNKEKDEQTTPTAIDLTPISKIVQYKFKSDINADLKIRQKQDDIVIKGFANVENIEFLLSNNLLKNNFIKTEFNSNKIVLKSDFSLNKTEKFAVNADIKTGKKPHANVQLNTDKLNLKDGFAVITSLLDISNIKTGAEDFVVDGILKSNLNIKTDLKNMTANGSLSINNASVTHKKLPLTINTIIANVTCKNNDLNIAESMFVNGAKVSINGKINKKSIADIIIKTETLPLNTLYTAFAPNDIKKSYVLKNGKLSLNVSLKGELQKIIPDVNLVINDLQLYDIANKMTVSSKNITTKLDCNAKTIVGKIIAQSSSVTVPNMFMLKAPEISAKFDMKDFILNNSTVYFNSSPIKFSGAAKDYANKMDINFVANGNIKAADLKTLLPIEYRKYSAASGIIPIKASITGDSKAISAHAQALADNNNNFTLLNIKGINNKQTLANAQISSDFKNIEINDISFGILNKSIAFSDNLSANTTNKSNLIAIKGHINNISTKTPSFKNFAISIPQAISANIPGMKNSSVAFSGNLSLNGLLNEPKINGDLIIPDLIMPDFWVKIKNIDLHFKNNSLITKCGSVDLNGSLYSGNATIQSIFAPVYVITDLNINSSIMDFDKLFKFIENFPQATSTSSGSGASGLALPVKITNGKVMIEKFVMGQLKVQDIKGDFTLINDLFSSKNFSLGLYGGTASGIVKYNMNSLAADVEMKGSDINVKGLITDFVGIKDQLLGTASFDTKITFDGSSYAEQMRSLKGYTNFTVKDGQFGNIGRFEYFIGAQNLLAQSSISKSFNSILSVISPKNTGQFDYLKGHLTYDNGYATLNPVSSAGQNMSLYITGKYNLINNYANMTVLGNISQEIVNILGPIGNFSLSKLISNFGKWGAQASALLNTYNQSADTRTLSNIPELTSKKEKKAFTVIINGNISSAAALKMFKWLSTEQEMTTTKSSLADLLKVESLDTTSPSSAAKDIGKKVLSDILNSGKNVQTPALPTAKSGGTSTTTSTPASQSSAGNIPQNPTVHKVQKFLKVLEPVTTQSPTNKVNSTTGTEN